jgi:hypothetical protein
MDDVHDVGGDDAGVRALSRVYSEDSWCQLDLRVTSRDYGG